METTSSNPAHDGDQAALSAEPEKPWIRTMFLCGPGPGSTEVHAEVVLQPTESARPANWLDTDEAAAMGQADLDRMEADDG